MTTKHTQREIWDKIAKDMKNKKLEEFFAFCPDCDRVYHKVTKTWLDHRLPEETYRKMDYKYCTRHNLGKYDFR